MKLVLQFENFYAGDLLVFSIDVDEVQHYDRAKPISILSTVGSTRSPRV